jgi:hypothetical protein
MTPMDNSARSINRWFSNLRDAVRMYNDTDDQTTTYRKKKMMYAFLYVKYNPCCPSLENMAFGHYGIHQPFHILHFVCSHVQLCSLVY